MPFFDICSLTLNVLVRTKSKNEYKSVKFEDNRSTAKRSFKKHIKIDPASPLLLIFQKNCAGIYSINFSNIITSLIFVYYFWTLGIGRRNSMCINLKTKDIKLSN